MTARPAPEDSRVPTMFVAADDGHGTASLWVREPDGYLRAIVSSLDLPPDSRKYWPELVALVTGQPDLTVFFAGQIGRDRWAEIQQLAKTDHHVRCGEVRVALREVIAENNRLRNRLTGMPDDWRPLSERQR